MTTRSEIPGKPTLCFTYILIRKDIIDITILSFINLHTFLLYICVCAKSLQSWLTLCDPLDYSPPGTPVHGIPRQEYWSGLPFPYPYVYQFSSVQSLSHVRRSPGICLSLGLEWKLTFSSLVAKFAGILSAALSQWNSITSTSFVRSDAF